MIATLVSTTTSATTDRKRREPLRVIEMTAAQAQSGRGRKTRGTRLSSSHDNNDNDQEERTKTVATESRKRKTGYDEDVEGFQFTRNASKKQKPSTTEPAHIPSLTAQNTSSISHEPQPSPRRGRPPKKKKAADAAARSAIVTNPREETTRSAEPEPTGPATRTRTGTQRATDGGASVVVEPSDTSPHELPSRPRRKRDVSDAPVEEKKRRKGRPSKSRIEERDGFQSPEPHEREAGTSKVALPLADTPVIQRNKDMRGAKSGKQRRDSLGMRGRRASSLIDSGASNALPHKEVDAADFYKHIASDGLPEPRRMRQLLIWCATRAMGDKPSASRAEDQSAWLAARVIQEELLKDLSTNSELSNWFGREDSSPPAVIVKKPNPKNVQNAEKIKELEEQIQRLQRERHALNALLRPPAIPRLGSSRSKPPPDPSGPDQEPPQSSSGAAHEEAETVDTSVLDASQHAIVALLESQPQPHAANKRAIPPPPSASSSSASTDTPILPPFTPSSVSARLSRVTRGIAPTLDAFAAGVHDIDLYRATADRISSQILRICAQRLDERDTRAALGRLALRDVAVEGDSKGIAERRRDDLAPVLGALSRVERR